MDKNSFRYRFQSILAVILVVIGVLAGFIEGWKVGIALTVLMFMILFALSLMHTFYNRMFGLDSTMIEFLLDIDSEDY